MGLTLSLTTSRQSVVAAGETEPRVEMVVLVAAVGRLGIPQAARLHRQQQMMAILLLGGVMPVGKVVAERRTKEEAAVVQEQLV